MKKVKEALNLQITVVHFWSDSSIVISWIHRESRELKTFVANRVSKINQLSSREQWHHIASEQNPADVLSRGLLPEELRDDSLWWHGPELLQSTYSTTVIAGPTQRDDFDCELRVSVRTLETSLLNSKNFDFFNHLMDLSNNYFKIIHIVSYIYRFLHNCRSKVKKRGPLTTSEVNDAETWLIKQDQSGINLSDPSDQNLAAYFTEEGSEWNFIPPRAPHMGGLWEAVIKSVKYHLKRALGRSRLTYEEFETVIIQPLAENNKGNSGSSEKMEYQLSEYTPTERKVDVIEKDNLMCGTMVIVKEDFTPVCNWLLGRVVEVYHGSDGKEYEDLAHMREIKADGSGVSFYMPHHGVYRPEKSTTKLRTVFNASSPSTREKSLNSIQFNLMADWSKKTSFPLWFASENTSMPLLRI
ncbi:uncharacterized protein TNCV_3362401 [Trichonephila clavipes]|nr:uncharacterized protein TNCV_3362401 [Trichonephila clavipes]